MQDLIWAEIEKVNANFARVETIKKFFLIEQQLTAEDEELTPTLKLKRSFVNKKFAKEIDAMYGVRAAAEAAAFAYISPRGRGLDADAADNLATDEIEDDDPRSRGTVMLHDEAGARQGGRLYGAALGQGQLDVGGQGGR